MSAPHSDALVFFGATGDLAYKKIFPALQAMVKRGHLDVPVIGVAKAGWDLDQSQGAGARQPRTSTAASTRRPSPSSAACSATSTATTTTRRRSRPCARNSATAQHPAHYLAIPPVLFGMVVEQLGKSGCAEGARVIVEKPFGRDLASAQALNQILLSNFDESAIFRIDHYLGKTPGAEPALSSASPTRSSSRSGTATTSRACRSRWPRTSASRAAARSTRRPARSATWSQNHLLQVLANLAMEPPAGTDSESIRDEKVKVLQGDPAARRRTTSSAASSAATATRRAWRPTRRSRRSPPCGWRSTPGAGRACRSTSGPASACP